MIETVMKLFPSDRQSARCPELLEHELASSVSLVLRAEYVRLGYTGRIFGL